MAIASYSAPNGAGWREIPLEQITPSAANPRRRFDETALAELAESIREHGVLQPIVLRTDPDRGYEIVAGERRFRAAQMAGLSTIPATVRDLTEEQALRIALIENLQRQDLDPLEEAMGYRQLAQLGMKQAEIGAAVHRSQPAIANSLRLLELPDSVKERIRQGELSASHGVAIASHKVNSKVQEGLAKIAVEKGLPSKAVEGYFREMMGVPEELEKYIYGLGYDTKFDWRKECIDHCPHGAYRKGKWAGFCLQPGCYEAKQKAAVETVKETTRETVDQLLARVPAGQVLADKDMRRVDYNWLTDPPPGCQGESCPRARMAHYYSGKDQLVCLDRSCFQKLSRAKAIAEGKADRIRYGRLKDLLARKTENLMDVSSQALALLVLAALRYRDRNAIRTACDHHRCLGHEQAFHMEVPGGWEKSLDRLAELDPVDLVKVGLEALLLDELRERYEKKSISGTAVKAEWWLGVGKPEGEGAA